ncbi:MAG: 3-keto-5-aminohexanoate cleavage protein [Nocardioidaceae bacterium]|nr:3-keto-5-aminohexanoate cleavage protein [Nocardioidaceae bacterium]
MTRKVILTVAPTGGFLTKAQTPHVPTQPAEIVADVVRCHGAGASMVALHARRPDDQATCDPAVYRAINEGIRERCDIVLGNSTGGGFDGDLAMPGTGSHRESRVEERSRGCEGGAEVCSVNAMTVLGQTSGPPVLMSTTREESRALVAKMAGLGVKPEWEAFSPTHLTQDIAALTAELPGPHWVSLCFGLDTVFQGAVGFDVRTLQFMVDQLPPNALFGVTGQGPVQVSALAAAIVLGGHVRVGIEDSRWDAHGELRPNAWFVAWAVRLIEALGCAVATPAEARALLGLPLTRSGRQENAGERSTTPVGSG